MLRNLLKIFFTLAGLFAAVAGLNLLGRKSAEQYIEVYGDEEDEDEAF